MRRDERVAAVTLLLDDLISDYQDDDLTTRRTELQELIRTAGGTVVTEFTQSRGRPDPATFIGRGKVREIAETAEDLQLDAVIFNHELSAGQQAELEDMMKLKVIDRTRLILDIFAQRAQSKEGKLQVELAQLTYILPRLTGMGEQMSRLAGGIGTRGPGETKLETDRRRVRRRMTDLRRRIVDVRRHRQRMRDRRRTRATPTFALVGYTNAGKSTLLNRLTDAGQFTEDKLFATLDPLVRQIKLPHSVEACMIDTVGFIQDLPAQLMAAFRATLEEITGADYIMHVVDISHDDWMRRVDSVLRVLHELGAEGKETITVLNKLDAAEKRPTSEQTKQLSNPITISALHGIHLAELRELMSELIERTRVRTTFAIPYSKMDVLDELHRCADVISEKYTDDGVRVEVSINESMARQATARLDRVDSEEQEGDQRHD